MLRDDDLQAFLSALEKSDAPHVLPAHPRDVLLREDGLLAPEIARLISSLHIATVLGDAPPGATAAAHTILDQVRNFRCAAPRDQDAWSQAINWARQQPAPLGDAPSKGGPGRQRQDIVGAACLRLRNRGYKVCIGGYGPEIAQASRLQIVRAAEGYIALLGGFETASQVLRFMRDAKYHHDGMWLFGEVGLNVHDEKRPMLPVGWLFSLALRYLRRPGRARKPEVAWRSLVELATDFAAAHDCQRYGQFEEIELHPSQLHRALRNSILWREFFTLPQVPAKALPRVLDALTALITPDDEKALGVSMRGLVEEIHHLMRWSADDKLTAHPRASIEKALPLLMGLTGGAAETVNADYGDPLAAGGRMQDTTLLFSCGPERVATLPRAFLAAAACEHVFRLIWSKLEAKRASKIVGQTLEDAISEACKDKAQTVLARQEYYVGKQRYELDLAACDGDHIVLIETKGKSLTRNSREGDLLAFLQDYSDSLLAMLTQLVRHEAYLKNDQLTIPVPESTRAHLRLLKIAVSPLSYGPVSDKLLANRILRSLVTAKLTLVEPNSARQKVLDTFNKRVANLIGEMAVLAPQKDGRADFFAYLIDIFWLDLGQLLYILDRATTVGTAFEPLQYITFSSRDFWTELAHADRSYLTREKWRPVSTT